MDRKLLEATWKHPCFRGSERQKRAASKAPKRACASEREKERHRKGGGRVERGRGRMRAKSGGMSLVSSCLHKAAPHQIAFVLNIWIGGYGPRTRWLEGMPREKEKGSGYNTPYPTQGPPRPTRTYDKERKREREWLGWKARARRKESSTVYDTTRFLGIPQFREPILQPPFPLRIYRTSLLSVQPPLSSLRPDIGFPIT